MEKSSKGDSLLSVEKKPQNMAQQTKTAKYRIL